MCSTFLNTLKEVTNWMKKHGILLLNQIKVNKDTKLVLVNIKFLVKATHQHTRVLGYITSFLNKCVCFFFVIAFKNIYIVTRLLRNLFLIMTVPLCTYIMLPTGKPSRCQIKQSDKFIYKNELCCRKILILSFHSISMPLTVLLVKTIVLEVQEK